jgi:hypothetical protein
MVAMGSMLRKFNKLDRELGKRSPVSLYTKSRIHIKQSTNELLVGLGLEKRHESHLNDYKTALKN